METYYELDYAEQLFLALADKTRLRLICMMRDGEVCVDFFAKALMLSQPKVSRHLAYLRNAGLVTTRRQGKWIYYGINSSMSSGGTRVLNDTIDWLSTNDMIRLDRERILQLEAGKQEYSAEPVAIEVLPNPPFVRNEEIETFLL